MVRFHLLGPVELVVAGRAVELGPPQRRLVVAALLVDPGRQVPVDTLIGRVWGEHPPAQPRAALHAHVARIRRVLAAAGGAALLRSSGGYLITAVPDQVDVHRCWRCAAEARDPERGDVERVDLLREAVAAWRGQPLAGLPGDWAARTREAWTQQHLDLLVAWSRAELQLGNHEAVVERLPGVIAEHPVAEPVVVALLRAFHAAGRDAEALAGYAALRERLADELGSEPGREARDLHRLVLRAGPASSAPPTRPVPGQLPAVAPGFTGRRREIERLDALLPGASAAGGAAAVGVLSGTAGVGKTALAVRWAHRVRSRFPDGQLYADLSGFAPAPPSRPVDVLGRFLRALGIPAEQVPADQEEASALFRSTLLDRRVLVLLDNAREAEQVRPMLPGTAGCTTLVTSRHRLAGLAALEGAHLSPLDVLTSGEAQDLVEELVDRERIAEDPLAVARLVELCGRLPLALRIAVATLAHRRDLSVVALADTLSGDDRLARLSVAGDDEAAVRVAFDHSYAALGDDARWFFRSAGLAPVADLTVESVAATAGTDPSRASRALEVLVAAHLVERRASDRFAFHDLVHLHAVECAQSDPAEARAAAVVRLLRYYLDTAVAAAELVHPDKLRVPRPVADPPPHVAALADRTQALAWLDAERPNLVRVVESATAHGHPAIAWRLADTLRGYYWLRMPLAEWRAVARAGLAAAEADGDPHGRGAALLSLGDVHRCLSYYRTAMEHYRQAESVCERAGWVGGRAAALGNLGNVCERAGQLTEAAAVHARSLALDIASGRLAGQAASLANLGSVLLATGRLDEAVDHLERAQVLDREIGSPVNEAMDLTSLAAAHRAAGRPAVARTHLERARTLQEEAGEQGYAPETLRTLALLDLDAGRAGDALDGCREALRGAREVGNRRIEADCLTTLGEIQRDLGRYEDAAALHERALELARATAEQEPEVRALLGLAAVRVATGATAAALQLARQAQAQAGYVGYRLLEQRAARLVSALGGAGAAASPVPEGTEGAHSAAPPQRQEFTKGARRS